MRAGVRRRVESDARDHAGRVGRAALVRRGAPGHAHRKTELGQDEERSAQVALKIIFFSFKKKRARRPGQWALGAPFWAKTKKKKRGAKSSSFFLFFFFYFLLFYFFCF
jgi:hypothetical protein